MCRPLYRPLDNRLSGAKVWFLNSRSFISFHVRRSGTCQLLIALSQFKGSSLAGIYKDENKKREMFGMTNSTASHSCWFASMCTLITFWQKSNCKSFFATLFWVLRTSKRMNKSLDPWQQNESPCLNLLSPTGHENSIWSLKTRITKTEPRKWNASRAHCSGGWGKSITVQDVIPPTGLNRWQSQSKPDTQAGVKSGKLKVKYHPRDPVLKWPFPLFTDRVDRN